MLLDLEAALEKRWKKRRVALEVRWTVRWKKCYPLGGQPRVPNKIRNWSYICIYFNIFMHVMHIYMHI